MVKRGARSLGYALAINTTLSTLKLWGMDVPHSRSQGTRRVTDKSRHVEQKTTLARQQKSCLRGSQQTRPSLRSMCHVCRIASGFNRSVNRPFCAKQGTTSALVELAHWEEHWKQTRRLCRWVLRVSQQQWTTKGAYEHFICTASQHHREQWSSGPEQCTEAKHKPHGTATGKLATPNTKHHRPNG